MQLASLITPLATSQSLAQSQRPTLPVRMQTKLRLPWLHEVWQPFCLSAAQSALFQETYRERYPNDGARG